MAQALDGRKRALGNTEFCCHLFPLLQTPDRESVGHSLPLYRTPGADRTSIQCSCSSIRHCRAAMDAIWNTLLRAIWSASKTTPILHSSGPLRLARPVIQQFLHGVGYRFILCGLRQSGDAEPALTFTGTTQVSSYLSASDRTGASTGWVQEGTWGIQTPPPCLP